MFQSNVLRFVVFGLLALSPAAIADTTGTVILGGTVTSSLEVTSNATSDASALDLSGGQKIVKVSEIEMSTNNEQGLTLSATSGDLTKSGGTSIAFKVTSVNAGDTAPAAGAFLIASGTAYTVGTTVKGSITKDLYILYNPATLQDPGDYEAEIDLTVTDK